jgi:hypothetical protein
MIKIHRDHRVIFWLMIGGLVLNILWSFRLELQAKTTKTIVQQYHLNLNKKIDKLDGLKEFERGAEWIQITTNDGNSNISLSQKDGQLFMRGGLNTVLGMGKSLGGTPEKIYLISGDKKRANLHLSSDRTTLKFNDSKKFHITMARNQGIIELRHHGSIFRVGKAPQGEGIVMGEKGSGTLIIRKDKGIGITTGVAQILLDRPGKGGKLTIEADGDINIQSKNGVVRINGKKIHMNKQAKAKGSPTLPPKLKSIPVPLDEPTDQARRIYLEEPPKARWLPLPLEKDDPNDPKHRLKPYQGPYSTE